MIRRLQSVLIGLTALLVTLLLGIAAVQANTTLGAYQLVQQPALGDQHALHLTALGNFDYHAKTASECCNATNRVTPEQLGDAQRQLDELSASLRGQRNPPVAAVDASQAANSAAALGDGSYALFRKGWSEAAQKSWFNFGTSSGLTTANVAEGLFDATISAGINSLAYNTSFGEGFKNGAIQRIVALGLADVHTGIGNVFQDGANGGEGSLGHIALHALAGCAAAELQGADCGAGAAGGATGAIASAYFERNPFAANGSISASDQEEARIKYEANITALAASVAGFLFSDGDLNSAVVVGNIGRSTSLNNRNLHISEVELIEQYADEFAEELCNSGEACIGIEEAKRRLTAETLRGVSDDFEFLAKDDAARQFLNSLNWAGEIVDGQTLFAELAVSSENYINSYLNIENVERTRPLYSLITNNRSLRNGEARTAVDIAYVRAASELPALATKDQVIAAADGLAREEQRLRVRASELIDSDDIDEMMHGFALETDADSLKGHRQYLVSLQLGKFTLTELAGNSGDPRYASISGAFLDTKIAIAGALDASAALAALNRAPNSADDFMGAGTFRSGDVVVQHRDNVIALGDDAATTGNFGRAPDFGEDVQTVIVHGNRDGTFNINGQDVPASTVAELIQTSPNHNPNSTIFLGSCHSGFCTPQVGAEGAQLLSNITGQPVIAPNVRTQIPRNPADGTNWTLDQNGSWQTYLPE